MVARVFGVMFGISGTLLVYIATLRWMTSSVMVATDREGNNTGRLKGSAGIDRFWRMVRWPLVALTAGCFIAMVVAAAI